MGIVYLAEQTTPNRHVALKTIKTQNHTLEKLLLQEAMITGSLSHPDIIPIFEISKTENGLEVLMQKVEGKTLQEMIDGQPQKGEDLRFCISVLLRVCQALEYAHTKNIVHRDIKPENIMYGQFGEVYLLDWEYHLIWKNHKPIDCWLAHRHTWLLRCLMAMQVKYQKRPIFICWAQLYLRSVWEYRLTEDKLSMKSLNQFVNRNPNSFPTMYLNNWSICISLPAKAILNDVLKASVDLEDYWRIVYSIGKPLSWPPKCRRTPAKIERVNQINSIIDH